MPLVTRRPCGRHGALSSRTMQSHKGHSVIYSRLPASEHMVHILQMKDKSGKDKEVSINAHITLENSHPLPYNSMETRHYAVRSLQRPDVVETCLL